VLLLERFLDALFLRADVVYAGLEVRELELVLAVKGCLELLTLVLVDCTLA